MSFNHACPDVPAPVIADSAVLENSSVIGTGTRPVAIGQRTVFGHRCQVIAPPERPSWALTRQALQTLVRL